MRIPFACPSCAAAGSVDASAAGRQARCKHCGCSFTIPSPGEPEPVGYSLEEPEEQKAASSAFSPPGDSTFVQSRGDHATAPAQAKAARAGIHDPDGSPPRFALSRRDLAHRGRGRHRGRTRRDRPPGSPRHADRRLALMALGMLMVLAGFGVGAYGAFHEDSLYGFLYLVIPLYTAYYMLTRWDDLWVWFACSTAGAGLVLLGAVIIEWGGLPV